MTSGLVWPKRWAPAQPVVDSVAHRAQGRLIVLTVDSLQAELFHKANIDAVFVPRTFSVTDPRGAGRSLLRRASAAWRWRRLIMNEHITTVIAPMQALISAPTVGALLAGSKVRVLGRGVKVIK